MQLSRKLQKMAAKFFRTIWSYFAGSEDNQNDVKNFEEMPGPRPLPIIGNIWRYFPVIGDCSLDRLHRTYQRFYEVYGPIVREKMFGERIIVHVYHQEDMMKVYKADGNMPKRLSHRALERYRRERPHLYSGPGLFPSNGEEWYNFRHLFQTLLMKDESVEACSNDLEDVTNDLIARISAGLDENKEIDLTPLLFNWALECTGSITLNRRLGCLSTEGNKEAESLIKAANDTHSTIFLSEALPFSFNYKTLEAAQNLFSEVVSKYLDEVIEDNQNGKNTDSLVAQMLELEDASRRDVFTMILDMFMAGIDTTAFTLSFALYNLAKNKEVQQKLRDEVIELYPTKCDRFTGAPLRSYRYLRDVVKETLRVNPVAVGTGRILQEDLVLGNYCVPAETMVILQHQASSLNEKYFPNAHHFDPDRWKKHAVTNNISCPFGYGHRMCVGKKFAYRELYLAISKMVRNFEISYHYEDIDSVNRLINVPDKPLRLRLQHITE